MGTLEFEIKNKEIEKIKKYEKKRYKVFTFAVPENEYEIYKEFFKNKGGFSKFIKEIAEEKGLKRKIELIKSVRAIKEHSLKEYEELEGSLSDGL